MSVISGELFYGSFWRIEPDKQTEAEQLLRDALQADDNLDLYDMLDDLESKNKDCRVHIDNGTITIYFGLPITTLNEVDNEFDEMALLRTMDLNQGTLRADIRTQMKTVLDSVPYNLRDKFTPPVYGVAWSAH